MLAVDPRRTDVGMPAGLVHARFRDHLDLPAPASAHIPAAGQEGPAGG